MMQEERLNYPPNHIEVDNRLSWFLGKLDKKYGNEAIYVHLKRNREAVAASYNKRWDSYGNIMPAYTRAIILQEFDAKGLDFCLDFIDTVNSNIELFLKDKTQKMPFQLENALDDFPVFWKKIGAAGDFVKAMQEWETAYNTGKKSNKELRDYAAKMKRVLKGLPTFIKEI